MIFSILLFLFAFHKEFLDILQILLAVLKTSIGLPFEIPEGVSFQSVIILGFNLIFGFGLVCAVWMLLISWQALMPVQNFQEVQRTAWSLLLFILRMLGPAVFIKDGSAILTPGDEKRKGAGVIVTDFNSAVVLEERITVKGLSRPFSRLFLDLLVLLGLSNSLESPRARGPGIVFTRPRERIRGVVDLRRQFRMERKVPCYTREGIELSANVSTIFTIGQDPDVLWVTYLGERRQEDLRVVTLERTSHGAVRVTGIQDELDEPDRREIHHFARWQFHNQDRGQIPWIDFDWPPTPPATPVFNKERVFAAVFAQARNNSQEILSWTDLPARVAVDFYREILLQTNYDDLYDIKRSGSLPLGQYKRKLRLAMRNNGILSYRFIFLREGEITPNRLYQPEDFIMSETQVLTNSKVLRDRGIKVLLATFGDPLPVSEAVYKQRLDSWRARWERDVAINRAERDLEASRVGSRAYAETQKDMVYALTRIFEQPENSDEAVAFRIMQALEKISADPKTRQLLPNNTVDLLRTVYSFLLPKDTPWNAPMNSAVLPRNIPGNGGNVQP